VRKFLF
jgi:hypothetical protein